MVCDCAAVHVLLYSVSVSACLSVCVYARVSVCVQGVVLLAALVCDGLGLIANTKAAVVRLGLAEMISLSRLFYPSQSQSPIHTHAQWTNIHSTGEQ